LEGDQPGFDFLGFHIRQYRVSKHHSGRNASGHRLGFKTLIKPAKANIQRIFRPHFAARRTISEGYLPSCILM
jgi:RNA-directed DNA polymerase